MSALQFCFAFHLYCKFYRNSIQITGGNSEDEIISNLVVLQPFGAKALMLYNCTTVNLDLYSYYLKAGSQLTYLNVKVLPNLPFKDIIIAFHQKREFYFGRLNEETQIFINHVHNQTKVLNLSMKKSIKLESKKNPCLTKLEGNANDALEAIYIDQLNCTLPWLVGESKCSNTIKKKIHTHLYFFL